MKWFVSDLDNTLIFSYKQDIGRDKVLVETKEEKELSFMTKKSFDLLNQLRNIVKFVPVTTRSLEQYQRIHFSNQWVPEYALVSNGGILLYHNKIDEKWYHESLHQIESVQEELQKGRILLQKDCNVNFEIRKVDELFIFTKSKKPEDTIFRLEQELDISQVSVFSNGTKIYILPQILNKGTGIERLKKMEMPEYVYGAGDSRFDISMLEKVDFNMLPESLYKEIQRIKEIEKNGYESKLLEKNLVVEDNDIFSDRILEYLWKELG